MNGGKAEKMIKCCVWGLVSEGVVRLVGLRMDFQSCI